MANIIYNIGFKTDASNIQSQLATIQKDIEQAFKRGGSALNAELTEGVKQASILSDVLQKAQTEKGTSFINMNKALMQAGSSASQMVAALSGAGMKQSLNTFLQTFASADRNLIGINSKVKEMMRVLTQSVKFNFAMGLQNFVIGQIQGAVTWSRELNKALTDIAVVSPEVAGKLDQVGESIIRNSRALRVSAQDYAEAALIFYQQGLDPAEVERRTEITIKAAAASGQAVQEMSEQLTAVWNTYQMQGDGLERAASVAAKLGAETAAAFEDIAVGMQIAASGASILGVSYDSLAAIMATVRETTLQSASTIGNAYKTIFARFSNLKTTGEDAGESLGRITQQLADMGVNVLDASGELRDLDDVILQLGTSWDNYGRKQRIAIAQIVGGVRQYQQFIALMENFDKYQKNLASAQAEVDGSELARQYMETLKSVDSAILNSTEAWRRAFAQLFTDESQLTFYRTLENIGNVVGDIIKGFGGLEGVLVVVGALLASKIVPAFRDIGFGIKQWATNLTITGQMKDITKETERMQTALQNLAKPRAEGGQGVDTSADQRKLEITSEVAKQQTVLNRLIRDGNAETRIRAQYLQDQLKLAQETALQSLDELDSLRTTNQETANLAATEAAIAQDRATIAQLSIQARQDELDMLIAQQEQIIQNTELEAQSLEQQVIAQESKQRSIEGTLAAHQASVDAAEAHLRALEESGTASEDQLDSARQYVAQQKLKLTTAQQLATAEGKNTAALKQQEAAAKQSLITQKSKLEQLKNQLTALQGTVTASRSQAAAFKTSEQMLKAMSAQSKLLVEGPEKAAENAEELRQALEAARNEIDTSTASGQKLAATLEDAVSKLTSGEDIGDSLQQLSTDTAAYNREAGITGPILEEMNGELAATANAASDLSQAQAASATAQNQVNSVMAQGRMSITGYLQELGKVVGGFMMVTTGITNMMDAFQSGEMTVGSFVGSMMMIIPGLVAVYGSIMKVVSGLIAKKAAQVAESGTAATGFAASLLRAAGYTAEGTAATAALAPTLLLTAAIIAIVAIIAVVVIAIMSFVRAAEEQRKANLAGAEASAESAKANLELRDSLQEVNRSLSDTTDAYEEGTVTLEEYTEAVATAREELVNMMKENPQFRIDLMEFDAATPARKIEMLQEAAAEANERIRQDAEKTRDYINAAYGDGLVSDKELDDDKGVEALKDSMAQLPKELQEQIQTAEGYWDLEGIANNWEDLMENMSATQRTHFTKMMGEMDGFTDLLDSTIADQAAAASQAFLAMQQQGDQGAFINMIAESSAADQIRKDNEDTLNALQERSAILTAEKEALEAQLDEYYMTGYSEVPYQEMIDQLNIVKGHLILVEQERQGILTLVAEKMDEADMSYEQLMDEVMRSGTEEERKTMQAIQMLAAATGQSINEIASAAQQSSAELGKAIALIEANRADLIGLGEEYTLVINLALEDKAIDGIKTKMMELSENIDEMTAKDKITWLDEMNEQIKAINETIVLTGGEPINLLSEGFFKMSAASQEAYLNTIQEEMATRNLVNAQSQLTANQELRNSILADAVTLTGDQNIKTREGLQAALDVAEGDLKASQLVHEEKLAQVREERAAKLKLLEDQLAAAEQSAAAGKNVSEAQLQAIEDARKALGDYQDEIARDDESNLANIAAAQERYDELTRMQTEYDQLLAQERVLEIEVDEATVAKLNDIEKAAYYYDQTVSAIDSGNLEDQAAAISALEAAWDDLVKATADGIGIDEDVLADYSKHIMRTAKASDLLSNSLADNQKAALKVAAATIRANEGYGKLESNLDNIKETIKGINKNEIDIGSQRAMEDINALDEALSDILNIDMGQLSLEFLTSEKAIRLAEDALNGVEGALWQLQTMAGESLLQQWFPEESWGVFEALHGEFASLIGQMDQAIEGGWLIGDSLDAINQADFSGLRGELEGTVNDIVAGMQAMGASAEDVQAYFNSMGLHLEGETREETVPGPDVFIEEKTTTVVPDGNRIMRGVAVDPATGVPTPYSVSVPQYRTQTTDTSHTIPGDPVTQRVFTLQGEDGFGGFNLTNNGSGATKAGTARHAPANRGGGGRGTGGSGGGGGGGGGSEPKVVTAERKDHTDRFRDINDALAEVARRMEKVNNASDKAFGLNKLRLLAANNSLLQEQAKLYDKLRKEAQNYLNVSGGQAVKFGESYMSTQGGDKATLNRMLKQLGGVEAGFTDDDFVKNAEEVMNSLYAMQAQKAAEFGGVMNETTGLITFATDEAGEEQKKLWEEWLAMVEAVKGQIERVNEAAQTATDAAKAELETIHTWLTNQIAETDLKLELRLRVNAMDLKQIEFMLERLGDRASSLQFDGFNESADLAISRGKALIDNYTRLEEIITNVNIKGAVGGEMRDWFLDPEEGGFSEKQWDEFLASGGALTQEMMDNLYQKAEDMLQVIKDLHAESERIFGLFKQMVDVHIRDFERALATYDNHTTMLDAWKDLWMIAGTPWKNMRMEIDLMNKSISNQTSKVKGLKQEQDYLAHAASEAQKVYEAAVAAHGPLFGGDPKDMTQNQRIVQEAYENWKDLQAQVESTAATVMQETAAMAQMFEEMAARAAEIIRQEFQQALGGVFADLEGFSAMFSQRKTMDTFFMHIEDAGLRLGKLLQETMDNPELLKDAGAWEQYLNSMIEKRIVQTEVLGEMREHEVWVTKDGVQLTEKQLAIIEEQFELEKQQAAFQEQQEMKKTMRLARDASGNWSYVYSADQEPEDDKAQAIEDRLANIRKMHREAVDELTDFWAQQMLEWEEFEANVDQRRYEQDEKYRAQVNKQRAWYEEMMGTLASQINIHLDAIDMDFADTTLATILNLSSMDEANIMYTQSIKDMSEAFRQSWQDNQDALHRNLEEMGIDMDDFENTVREETDKIMGKNKENEQSIEDLNRKSQAELSDMTRKIEDWSRKWQSEISDLIRALQALIDKIRELQAAQGGVVDVEGFDYKTDYSAKMAEYESTGQADEAGRTQIAGERYNKQLAAYRQELEKFGNDQVYMNKVAEEWTAKIGKPIDMVSQREYIDFYLKHGKFMFDTGGMATGPMVAGLAMDGKKELILNNRDTENFLAAIQIMRDSIQGHLASLGMKQAGIINGVHSTTSETTNNQTPVIIQADFPNVSAREEIEAAFANLVNQAAQYQLKPRG